MVRKFSAAVFGLLAIAAMTAPAGMLLHNGVLCLIGVVASAAALLTLMAAVIICG